MAELLQTHLLQFTSSDSADTDTTWITGGAASTQTLINMLTIQNNDAVEQVVTVKLQTYVGAAYVAKFAKTYTISAGESEIIAELIGSALIGDASNPDKITVAFGTTLTSTDTIDCVGSSVKFS